MEKLFSGPFREGTKPERGKGERRGGNQQEKTTFTHSSGKGLCAGGLLGGSLKGLCCAPASSSLSRLSFQPHLLKG